MHRRPTRGLPGGPPAMRRTHNRVRERPPPQAPSQPHGIAMSRPLGKGDRAGNIAASSGLVTSPISYHVPHAFIVRWHPPRTILPYLPCLPCLPCSSCPSPLLGPAPGRTHLVPAFLFLVPGGAVGPRVSPIAPTGGPADLRTGRHWHQQGAPASSGGPRPPHRQRR
ncbi:hypothetical protein GQ53DRAFT_516103 [Thozetella sp. PMI_491]|nr:hypothetical protein GQ53DRAFT_516103 [Thozetella sp. PMI_491]